MEQGEKKTGRRARTEEEKAATAAARAARKEKAANMKPVVVLQYQGKDTEIATLIEAAKADFKAAKKRTPITELTVYLKPEENAAYYVVNGEFSRKLDL